SIAERRKRSCAFGGSLRASILLRPIMLHSITYEALLMKVLISVRDCIFKPVAGMAIAGEIWADGWAFAFILGISPCLEWFA
ncbi:MAG: hypothetical protein LC637_01100, partial [Xanthomonadaceae bacterium]|nr:hypothetical protein [Xanthomonadaceae bacterium]